jgi:hypothetical protein
LAAAIADFLAGTPAANGYDPRPPAHQDNSTETYMIEIETAVADAARRMVEDGRLAKLVAENVEATVAKIVKDAVGQYSTFGKSLEEAVAASLRIDPGQLGLPAYNQTVLAVVKQTLDQQLELVGRDKIKKDLERLLGTDAPAEMKLSELVELYRREMQENLEGQSEGRITAAFGRDDYSRDLSSFRWFYLHDGALKADRVPYESDIQMLFRSGGEIACARVKGVDPKKDIMLGQAGRVGFEKTLFRLYAAGTKIIIDAEEFETRYDNID